MRLKTIENPKISNLREGINVQLTRILPIVLNQEIGKRYGQGEGLSYDRELANVQGDIIRFSIFFPSNKSPLPPKEARGKRPLFSCRKSTAIYLTKRTAERNDISDLARKNQSKINITLASQAGEPIFYSFDNFEDGFFPLPHILDEADHEKMLEQTISLLTEFADLQKQYEEYQQNI